MAILITIPQETNSGQEAAKPLLLLGDNSRQGRGSRFLALSACLVYNGLSLPGARHLDTYGPGGSKNLLEKERNR